MYSRVFLFLLCACSRIVIADSYCDVSSHSPTYGMGFEDVDRLVWKTRPKASVECGLLKNLYKLESGNTTEEHYKNVVLLLDGDDERFVAVSKVDGLSIFAYTSNMGNEYHFALKGGATRLRPLIAGALAVVEFKDVTLPDGFTLYMPIFERVL